jgi:steroid 5-alpha reductase family enzyme
MDSVISLLVAWAFMALIMFLFYLIQLKTRNATLVDVVWAMGLVLTACFYGAIGAGNLGRRIILVLLASIWGLRLAFYLILRSAGKPEDGRYAMLRLKWDNAGARNFFLFYQAQASWVVLFSVPFLVVSHSERELWSWHDSVALIIWITAIAGEACADWQLNRFRADSENRGKTCCRGLWKYYSLY